MNIDQQIAEFLKADADVAAAVGTGIWLGMLPQGLKTGVVFEQISGPRDVTFDERFKVNARYQFTSYGETPIAARTIHDAIVAAIQFVRGDLISGGIFAESDVIEDERGPMYDDSRALWRYDADIIFSF